MRSKFEYQFELLKQEIDVLQNSIRAYDSMIMEVKKWAVAIYSSFLIVKLNNDNIDFIKYGIIGIFLFWLIDSMLKSIQACYIKRYSEIENYINSEHFNENIQAEDISNIRVPDISNQFKVTLGFKIKDIIRHASRFHNHLLYLSMLLFSAILWLTTK